MLVMTPSSICCLILGRRLLGELPRDSRLSWWPRAVGTNLSVTSCYRCVVCVCEGVWVVCVCVWGVWVVVWVWGCVCVCEVWGCVSGGDHPMALCLFPRFLVFPPANPSNFSLQVFSSRIPFLFQYIKWVSRIHCMALGRLQIIIMSILIFVSIFTFPRLS